MRIQRLLDYLKYSELANLNLVDLDTNADNRVKVFSYIDRALAAVNVEFGVNQTEIVLPLKPTQCRYYVNDAKLVKLLTAYYSDGTELYINNENTDLSVFTPALNIIDYRGKNLTTDTYTDYLSLIYLKGFDDVIGTNDIINLSEGLLECVASYVAYIAYSSIDMSGDSPAKSFFGRYKEAVAVAKANGFASDDNTDFSRLADRGFV
jgi:hypothetical protein